METRLFLKLQTSKSKVWFQSPVVTKVGVEGCMLYIKINQDLFLCFAYLMKWYQQPLSYPHLKPRSHVVYLLVFSVQWILNPLLFYLPTFSILSYSVLALWPLNLLALPSQDINMYGHLLCLEWSSSISGLANSYLSCKSLLNHPSSGRL